MGRYENVSSFKLLSRFTGLIRKLAEQEKQHAKEILQETVKAGLPGVIFIVAGVVLLALSGIFLLVALVLLLNTWFLPWVSALIVAAFFLLIGLVLGLAGFLKARKGFDGAQTGVKLLREDMKWLKNS